jgi:kynurenine formamidase
MLIDLTHTLMPSIPTWTLKCGFQSEIKLDYFQAKKSPRFRVQKLSMHAGIGTHMDAPSHCIENGASISDLPIENFVANGICIDISKKAIDASFVLQKNDIEDFEMNWGLITPRSIIIVYTGWSRFWLDPKKYVNDFKFPSISRQAAQYLIEKEALGIAVDTMSPDLPSLNHPVHELFLGSSRYIIENVANADLLPRNNFKVIALPIKAKDCTEAPIRLIAEI